MARAWCQLTGRATGGSRQEALERLTRPPFVLGAAGSQKQRVTGLGLLLDWLGDQPGRSWQERWLASGADAAGSRWRQVPAGWLRARGRYCDGRRDALCGALHVAIALMWCAPRRLGSPRP